MTRLHGPAPVCATLAKTRHQKDKKARLSVAVLFSCLFLGVLGAHKFYEGKAGMGILYLFTMGLFRIGWPVDRIVLLTKPNPYYV